MSQKKWTIKNILKEIFSTLIIFFILSMVINYIRKPDVSEDIYEYKLVDIKSDTVDFKTYKGKPLVVHFWATWCPTCKLEASNIETISKKYNVVTIAVNSGANEQLKTYMDEKKLTYRIINDANGVLSRKFNIGAYPTTLIYDTKGILKFTEVGYSTTLGLEARLRLAK